MAQAALEEEWVDDISPAAIREVRREADWKLQGFRYGKTTIWEDEAVARALKSLWSDERIESLWQKRAVVLGLDEKPNLQVLERALPKQPMRAGQIQRQEFEYPRHGTIHWLAGLTR